MPPQLFKTMETLLQHAATVAPRASGPVPDVRFLQTEESPDVSRILEEFTGTISALLGSVSDAKRRQEQQIALLETKQSRVRRTMRKICYWQEHHRGSAAVSDDDRNELQSLQDRLREEEKTLQTAEEHFPWELKTLERERSGLAEKIASAIEQFHTQILPFVKSAGARNSPESYAPKAQPSPPSDVHEPSDSVPVFSGKNRRRRGRNAIVMEEEISEWQGDHLEPVIRAGHLSSAIHLDMVWGKTNQLFQRMMARPTITIPQMIDWLNGCLIECREHITRLQTPTWDKACWTQNAEQGMAALRFLQGSRACASSFREWLQKSEDGFMSALSQDERKRFNELCSALLIQAGQTFYTKEDYFAERNSSIAFPTLESVHLVIAESEEFERGVQTLIKEMETIVMARRSMPQGAETLDAAKTVIGELWPVDCASQSLENNVKNLPLVSRSPRQMRNALGRLLSIFVKGMRNERLRIGTRMNQARFTQVTAEQLAKEMA